MSCEKTNPIVIKECSPYLLLMGEWQSILDLDDWTIKLNEDVSPNDMQMQGVSGECIWDEIHKAATINIINQKDYGDRILPFDKEKTLVHELLHIKFCMIDNSGNELFDKMLHQLIEDIAKSLIRTKRENKIPETT